MCLYKIFFYLMCKLKHCEGRTQTEISTDSCKLWRTGFISLIKKQEQEEESTRHQLAPSAHCCFHALCINDSIKPQHVKGQASQILADRFS